MRLERVQIERVERERERDSVFLERALILIEREESGERERE